MPKRFILFYDDTCPMCSRWVRFVLKRDHLDQIYFSGLDSKFAETFLLKHSKESIIYSENGKIFTHSSAVARLAMRLGGLWNMIGRLILLFPLGLRDSMYNFVARNRKHGHSCMLIPDKYRHKFLV